MFFYDGCLQISLVANLCQSMGVCKSLMQICTVAEKLKVSPSTFNRLVNKESNMLLDIQNMLLDIQSLRI